MIKAPLSPLQLVGQQVAEFSLKDHLRFRSDKPQKYNADKLSVELDFDLLVPRPEQGDEDQIPQKEFQLELSVAINAGRTKQTGYVMRLKTRYWYLLQSLKVGLPDKVRINLMQYSSLTIAVAEARQYLRNATAPFLWGGYELPVLDTQALISAKRQAMKPPLGDTDPALPE